MTGIGQRLAKGLKELDLTEAQEYTLNPQVGKEVILLMACKTCKPSKTKSTKMKMTCGTKAGKTKCATKAGKCKKC